MLTKGVIESRQSCLYGPFCCIYGLGAAVMIPGLQKFKKKNWTLFLAGAIEGSIVEYVISWLGELIIRTLGINSNINKVHPHKFRRTLATMAIDKGMPVEQVQKLLGHVKIETTMHYALVNQSNVKISHRRFIA